MPTDDTPRHQLPASCSRDRRAGSDEDLPRRPVKRKYRVGHEDGAVVAAP